MTALPWFRMYSEFSSDPVVQSLAFEDQRHYVVILCLKCNGTLDRKMDAGIRDRIIQRGLGLDSPTMSEAKRRLMEVKLIDNDWQPKGWAKRQYKSDNITERVRKYRKDKKTGNVSETLPQRSEPVTCNDFVTPQIQSRSDTDQNREKRGADKPPTPPRKRFEKPTIAEVKQYCQDIGSQINPATFFNHYETVGWKVGKNPMKDWKAAVRGWTSREGA